MNRSTAITMRDPWRLSRYNESSLGELHASAQNWRESAGYAIAP